MDSAAPPPKGAKPLSTLLAPRRLWWGRIGPDERLWLTVAFV